MAQTEAEAEITESFIEQLAEEAEGEGNVEERVNELVFLGENPMNINQADFDDWARLPFLTDYQITALLNYRYITGRFYTLYELAAIPALDRATIEKMLPFVFVGPAGGETLYKWKNALRYGRHNVMLRTQAVLETQDGFRQPPGQAAPGQYYPGNRAKYYTQYKYHYKDKLFWGLTAEKDPGEQFFAGPQANGFDYYSAHFQINGVGPFEKLVIGDFKAEYGQGLVLASGFMGGKNPYATQVAKRAQGLRRYSSANENDFFRGGGTAVQAGPFTLSAFFSQKQVDANITAYDSLAGKPVAFSALQSSGIHALSRQTEDKDAVQERVYGGHLEYRAQRFNLGASFLRYEFDARWEKDASALAGYSFSGRVGTNAAVDYEWAHGGLQFFGEAAVSGNHGWATLNGLTFHFAPQVSAAAIYRHYQPQYQALYSGAFAESAAPDNEQGLYLGLEVHPVAGWTLSAYVDQYSFPWLDYRLSQPAHGHDYFLQAKFVPTRKFDAYVRFKRETKPQDLAADEIGQGLKYAENTTKQYLRYHQQFQVSEKIILKNRFQWAYYFEDNAQASQGYLLYQDVKFVPGSLPLVFNCRLAAFFTDSYNSRIYAYESDVLYAFSVPAYYGQGMRAYIVVKYEAAAWLSAWLKIGQTYYTDRHEISSGLNRIAGNTRTGAKLQLRMKF